MKIRSFIIAIAAALAISATSCQHKGSSPAQQAIDLTESVIKKVEKATNIVELTSIQEEFQNSIQEIENPENYTPTAEEDAKLQAVMQSYLQAYIMKVNELADSSAPIPSDEVDSDAANGSVEDGIEAASEE